MQYILTIDSGNTNIKWGIFECGILVKNNRIHLQQANLLQAKFGDLPKPDFVIISHVASDQVKDAIVKSLSIWDVEVFWLHSSKKLCGVKNGYVNSQQLGSDRWASLIAAWHKIKQSCLIINAGTAVTVDALSDSGEHLGGIILPGIHLMHSSLTQNTQLPHNAIAGEFKSEFPLNTFDAIKTGIFFAMLGAIDSMHILLSKRVNHSNSICIVGGGSARFLVSHIHHPCKLFEHLVLEGLALIAKEINNTRS